MVFADAEPEAFIQQRAAVVLSGKRGFSQSSRLVGNDQIHLILVQHTAEAAYTPLGNLDM